MTADMHAEREATLASLGKIALLLVNHAFEGRPPCFLLWPPSLGHPSAGLRQVQLLLRPKL